MYFLLQLNKLKEHLIQDFCDLIRYDKLMAEYFFIFIFNNLIQVIKVFLDAYKEKLSKSNKKLSNIC